MKVKELIELLQKREPQDEIHIFIDNDIMTPKNMYNNSYAHKIRIYGHKTFYMDDDVIRSPEELHEYIMDENWLSVHSTIEEVLEATDEEMKNQKELTGLWITIEP